MKANKWLNQLCILTIIACMILTCLPTPALATQGSEEITAETEDVSAIPEDAIHLSTAEDILVLAENCISDVWSRDKVVILDNDINLNDVEFEGIPTFGGTFLGQGYTISGFHLTQAKTAFGFFRYLQKTAIVEDLRLLGSICPSGSGNTEIGGIVGINSGTLRDCSFSGTVSGNEQIGGVAGRNKVFGVIENCTVSGIIYGDHYIGGVAGENQGVIRNCINLASVNTHVDHNSTTLDLAAVLDLENFSAKESAKDATNIGGIAGTSSGVIRACENHADIGYEKMGYNVGGIAGSQIGYITGCVNYGTINGSDGVGGIVGQFKPNVVLEFGPNPIDTMTNQMAGMMNAMSAMMTSMSDMMSTMNFDMVNMEESLGILKDPENWDADSIGAAVNDMSNSFNQLYNNMSSMGSDMTDQMSGMMSSMSGMVSTMQDLGKGMDIQIIDVSKSDTPENILTKVSDCENHGSIFGENYTGGIIGIADVENTTANEDIEGEISFSNEGEVTMRLVIRDCKNLGTISASKQYAGGIVGNMTIGAVFNGMNTGNINALTADYIGGIAGSCDSYIEGSISRAILSGSQYVGGIAGYGTEVMGCYAITEIAAATKFAGGILGYTDPLPDESTALIQENRYYLTGKNLGGIDGICYAGATAPMSVREFLAVEDLDDMFRTVDIRFLVQDQDELVITLELGKTLALAKVPVLPAEEGQLCQWVLQKPVTYETLGMNETEEILYLSKERLTNILFDQTYQVVFNTKNTVVSTQEKTDSGRSLALAVGAFDLGTTLRLTPLDPAINGTPVLESWLVTMEDIGIERLHYYIPDDVQPDNLVLYVKDISGNWVQRDFTVEGSYMIFHFAHGETAFALEMLPEEDLPVARIAAAGTAVVLLLILCRHIRKRRVRKRGIASEKK